MKTKRLNLLDTAWLNVETTKAPMHVGGLLTFQLPDDAPADACRQIVDAYRTHTEAYPPWNHCLRPSRMKSMAPEWQLLDEIDTEYHFAHSALPAPGGERELGILASRLHSYPLDFRRPPWESHLIEGLENNRFAIYIKLHHSLIDGVSGMRLLARAMSKSADDLDRPPFWAIEPKKRRKKPADSKPQPGLMQAAAELAGGARHQVTSLPAMAGVVRDMLKGARAHTDAAGLPFSSSSSVLNSRIDSRRRYATQLYSLSEFKQLAKNAEVTINDIVLAVCASALRQYLRELGELPAKPLTAGIPVSVRPADEEEGGNAMTFVVASLATDIEDPEARLAAIAASTRRAKSKLENLSASAITQYTIALMAPFVLALVTGMAGRTRPVFNVTISNLPGPQEELFLHGARMEAFYPTSLVTHGQALNITVHGYRDTLGFGFIGCGDTLPSLQRIAIYAGEAVDELRRLYGPKTAGSAASADKRKQPSKRKTAG